MKSITVSAYDFLEYTSSKRDDSGAPVTKELIRKSYNGLVQTYRVLATSVSNFPM